MQFAPISFLNTAAAGYNPNTPNTVSDLTFWVDFSNADFYNHSNNQILGITSSVNYTASHYLSPYTTAGGSGSFYQISPSLSNPSLNSAKVIVRPTGYYATNWSNNNDNIVTGSIVVGPKNKDVNYPDSTEFYVYNRGSINVAGYLGARWDGSTDRGVLYDLDTGTPNTDIISYDFNSPSYLYYGTTNASNLILTRVNNSTTATLFRGSTQTASGSKNDQQIRHRQFNSIGRFFDGLTVSNPADSTPENFQYCELIIYNRVLTSEERTTVWNYLSTKWNISL